MHKQKYMLFVALAGLLLVAPAWAQRVVSYEEIRNWPSAPGLLIEAIFYVVFAGIVFGLIYGIAKRDMKGWDQPFNNVWFSFDGRLNRKAYWLKGIVGLNLVNMGGLVLYTLLSIPVVLVTEPLSPGLSVLAWVVAFPLIVFQLWVLLAIAVKRAHDLGHSGVWLLTGLIPIWNIWVMIQIYFLRGAVGPNTFGVDPIDPYNG